MKQERLKPGDRLVFARSADGKLLLAGAAAPTKAPPKRSASEAQLVLAGAGGGSSGSGSSVKRVPQLPLPRRSASVPHMAAIAAAAAAQQQQQQQQQQQPQLQQQLAQQQPHQQLAQRLEQQPVQQARPPLPLPQSQPQQQQAQPQLQPRLPTVLETEPVLANGVPPSLMLPGSTEVAPAAATAHALPAAWEPQQPLQPAAGLEQQGQQAMQQAVGRTPLALAAYSRAKRVDGRHCNAGANFR